MGAKHFRSLAPEMGDCCGSQRAAPEEAKRPGSRLVQENEIKTPRKMPEYRCSNEEECSPQHPASPEEDEILRSFLESRCSRRRPATVLEAVATFDNGMMAAMCTNKSGDGLTDEVEQHAAVLTPSELDFWGVEPIVVKTGETADQVKKIMGNGLSKLEWIWEDTLHMYSIKAERSRKSSRPSKKAEESPDSIFGACCFLGGGENGAAMIVQDELLDIEQCQGSVLEYLVKSNSPPSTPIQVIAS